LFVSPGEEFKEGVMGDECGMNGREEKRTEILRQNEGTNRYI
jgi:hypothetical protein